MPVILLSTLATLLFPRCTKIAPQDASLNSRVTAQDVLSAGAGNPINFSPHAPVDLTQLISAISPSTWMSKIPGKVKISHLTIPGTRESARYENNAGPFQTLAIADQLNNGVRSLHIDVFENTPGALLVNTSGPTAIALSDFFDTCINFLKQNATETILLTIDKGQSTPTWAADIDQKVMAQGSYFYRWPNYYLTNIQLNTDWPALNDVRGKIVLLTTAADFGLRGAARVLPNLSPIGPTAGMATLGAGVTTSSLVVDTTVKILTPFFATSADGYYQQSFVTSPVDAALPKKNALMYAFKTTENHYYVANLCLTTTGTATDALTMYPEINAFVEDILENSISGGNSNSFLRLGIVAMDFITPYESELLYLSNFNPLSKQYKNAITSDEYNIYNPDGSLVNQGAYNSTGYHSINFVPAIPTYPASDPNGPLQLFDITKIDPSKWMSYLPDTATLDRINIPGSHDALTWKGLLDDKCQSGDLNQQLACGVRDLDFRFQYESDIPGNQWFYAYHGIVTYVGVEMGDMFNILGQFLTNNPTETIIVHLALNFNGGYGGSVLALYNQKIMNFSNQHPGMLWTNPNYAKNTWPTMGELRGKIVLVSGTSMALNYYNNYPNWDGLGYVEVPPAINAFGWGSYQLWKSSSVHWDWPVYAQQIYTGLGYGNDALDTKLTDIWTMLQQSSGSNNFQGLNRLFINQTNYSDVGRILYPKPNAVYINPRVANYLKTCYLEVPATAAPLGRTEFNLLGDIQMDFVDIVMCSLVYLSNFRNSNYY